MKEQVKIPRIYIDLLDQVFEIYAEEQAALLRKGIGDLYVNLARRNQSLLDRQLALLDELERDTDDPDDLATLFELDHLSTRMRRNAESLLVLSGSPQPRQWRTAIPVIDVAPFAMIYGGAQKNIGPSGVTVVIADKSFIEQGRKDLPSILQYRAHAEARSLLNTPPTFGVYLVRNVLAWLKGIGGLEAIERRNREKAGVLYAAIDADPAFYRCPVEKGSRSVMNVVFRLPSEDLEKRFVDEAKKQGMVVPPFDFHIAIDEEFRRRSV